MIQKLSHVGQGEALSKSKGPVAPYTQQWEQFTPTSRSWSTTWMGSERKIPRFWVTSERRGSEWRREAGDGREGAGGGEERGGACSSMFYGIRGNLREDEERNLSGKMRNQRQEEVLDLHACECEVGMKWERFIPTSEPVAGETV